MNHIIPSEHALIYQQVHHSSEHNDSLHIGKRLSLLLDYRWLICTIALLASIVGIAYALLAEPRYETNLLIQVDDSNTGAGGGSPKNIQSDLSTVFDIKTATASELEILRSRAVVSRAVDQTALYIIVRPDFFPGIGEVIARYNKRLSEPGIFGYGAWVWGAERADVSIFDVPRSLEGKPFMLTVTGNNGYRLTQEEAGIDVSGRIGEVFVNRTHLGDLTLRVDHINARPGAQFELRRMDRLDTIHRLQKQLHIGERGKQSGIIGVTLEGSDPVLTSAVLNEIGREYIRQNVERKSQRAEKSLTFLERQLPDLKQELERSEAKYREFRNRHGTIDLSEESKAMVQQAVWSQTKIAELGQKKVELISRYEDAHPAVQSVNQQISELRKYAENINSRIKLLPQIEQETTRLSRDVKVNTELYTTLLGTAQQLRLATSSEVGNARLLDNASVPTKPVRPQRALVISLAVLTGLILGVLAAFVKKTLYGRIDDPQEVEFLLGLPISAKIPFSDPQGRLSLPFRSSPQKVSILPKDIPSDGSLESLRRLRNAIQHTLADADNNVIMVTGPTQGVGKTFVSVNFASVLATTGKKVLLIDADLRAGDLHRCFGLSRGRGLTNAIEETSVQDNVIHKEVEQNVDFISTGGLPVQPAELLDSPKFGALLGFLGSRYDYVVIDTPPVLAASEVLSIASHSAVIVNVLRRGVSTVKEIEESVRWLNEAGHRVTSTVFNDSKPAPRYSYSNMRTSKRNDD
jgi:tyrosine-protein kinase Etk/Wzc